MMTSAGLERLSEQEFQQLLQVPLDELDRELAERSLKEFILQSWHIVEPGRPFISGWHVDAICDHLEACAKGQIKKLIINVPPRHLKSHCVSVFWPAWEWTKNPSIRWVFTSYAERLSIRDSRYCRNVINSSWYQKFWGDKFHLVSDQNAKLRYDTDKMGYRIATSVGGVATGEGGDRIVCLPYDSLIDIRWWESQYGWKTAQMKIGEIVERKSKVEVLSYSFKRNKCEYKSIEEYEESDLDERDIIEIQNDKILHGRRINIKCTDDHPIFTKEKGYIPANQVSIGDQIAILKILQFPGKDLSFHKDNIRYCIEYEDVDRIIRHSHNPDIQKIYNLRIKDNHNYFANNILVHNCDDPHSALEALSDTKRQSVLTWWDDTMSTRDDSSETVRVLIMQRLHDKDLSGHLLAKEIGYELLCLPMEYEGINRSFTSLNFVDPRTEINELLHSDRYDRERAEDLKKSMTPYAVAGQLQQRPMPLKGGMIQWDWFRRYSNLPSHHTYVETVQVWDTAQKSDELLNCPWVCGTWMIYYDGFYLVDVLREWMNYPDGKKAVFEQAKKYNPNYVIIEDKSTGQSLIQEMPSYEYKPEKSNGSPGERFNWPIIAFEPEGDKITRMFVEAPTIQGGRVFIPDDAPWLADFETEVKPFPNSNTKDQVDMLSMFLKHQKNRVVGYSNELMAWSIAQKKDEFEFDAPPSDRSRKSTARATANMDW